MIHSSKHSPLLSFSSRFGREGLAGDGEQVRMSRKKVSGGTPQWKLIGISKLQRWKSSSSRN